MPDWRPDIRVAQRCEDPYAAQVAHDLARVEKARKKAADRRKREAAKQLPSDAAWLPTMVIVPLLSVTLIGAGLIGAHDRQQRQHEQIVTKTRICQIGNRTKFTQIRGYRVAAAAARQAHMPLEAKRFEALAQQVHVSANDCRS